MTNDNKDPQITAEIEEAVARGIHSAILGAGEFDEWWNNPEDKGAKDFLLGMVRGAITAYESRLSSELKQLRADNEISESTQAALYKSLLIIQRKYEQLRAERAGLIAEIDKEIIKLEPRLYKTDSEIEILYKFKKLKSKLTDSAQITTDTEGK